MKVLNAEQKAFYEDQGYLLLEQFVSNEWLDRLNQAVDHFIDLSRQTDDSTAAILVEPGHTRANPRLRRIPHTVIHHPVFEEFGLRGPLLDLAEDLLGADVCFHHSKLNFKWSQGGEEVKWHQDIQFWPHTNYSPMTIGAYLNDVTPEMAPMGVIPGSHKQPLFNLADEQGQWTGALNDHDLTRVNLDSVVWLQGPAGSVTVHSCRMVHGSAPNKSFEMRPLLLHTYTAADAHPTTNLMEGIPFSGQVVRGHACENPRHDAEPCPMPPDFRGNYSSIFAVQQGDA